MPRPSPSYPDTLTAEAEAEITAAVLAIEEARETVNDRIDDRNAVLRKHYAAGVDLRDLVRATSAGGTIKPLTPPSVSRLVSGARPKDNSPPDTD